MVGSFNLLDEPWIRVMRVDGSVDELSLLTLCDEISDILKICGDIPTQDMAILRLLIAISHRATDGPRDLKTWKKYWNNQSLFQQCIINYLERYRNRFDLRDGQFPFFQVAGIASSSGEISGLESLIPDVPNNEPFFTMRVGSGLDCISWAEGARWLIHAHAFDPSGIRTGAIGDSRVKRGKVYPIRPSWTGQIGVVAIQGDNLFKTILLNTVVLKMVGELRERMDIDNDRPPWEREPDRAEGRMDSIPVGPVMCYTWQSRRVLLHGTEQGVTGLFLGNGDKAILDNCYLFEPMTAWKYNKSESQKRKNDLFVPYRFSSEVGVWRGLTAFAAQRGHKRLAFSSESVDYIPPGVISFYRKLLRKGVFPRQSFIRLHCVGLEYMNPKVQSKVRNLIDDVIIVPACLFEMENKRLSSTVCDAMDEADDVAFALRTLGGDLVKAQGADSDSVQAACERAATAFYFVIDEEFPRWLASLADDRDPNEAKSWWRERLRWIANEQSNILVDSVGPSAYAGCVDEKTRERVNVGVSLKRFESLIRRKLPVSPDTQFESMEDEK